VPAEEESKQTASWREQQQKKEKPSKQKKWKQQDAPQSNEFDVFHGVAPSGEAKKEKGSGRAKSTNNFLNNDSDYSSDDYANADDFEDRFSKCD
jgi:hypothetical protein